MPSYPVVSILVPLYNHQDFIIPCVESVCGETYPNKELIIIDDGSTDASAERVQEWIAANPCDFPVQFLSRPNKGVSATLNELFELSHGEFVAFLSSDDLLISGGIAARVAYLAEHPEKLLVVGDCQVVDMSGALTFESGIEQLHGGRKRYMVHEQLIAGELIFHWSLAGPIYLFRRSFMEETGGYDHSLEVEDWDICLRLAAKGQIGFINTTVAAYRWHGANTAQRPEKEVALLTALYKTVVKNRALFSGLYWWHLWAYEFYLLRLIARKQRSPARFLLAPGGKMRKITEAIYEHRVARMMLN